MNHKEMLRKRGHVGCGGKNRRPGAQRRRGPAPSSSATKPRWGLEQPGPVSVNSLMKLGLWGVFTQNPFSQQNFSQEEKWNGIQVNTTSNKKSYHGSHRAYDHDTTTRQGLSPGNFPDSLKIQSYRMSSNTTKARDRVSRRLARVTWDRDTAGKVFRLRNRKADTL